jgi:predicted transcriptional regulator
VLLEDSRKIFNTVEIAEATDMDHATMNDTLALLCDIGLVKRTDEKWAVSPIYTLNTQHPVTAALVSAISELEGEIEVADKAQ